MFVCNSLLQENNTVTNAHLSYYKELLYDFVFHRVFFLFLCYSEILSLQVRITDQPLCALLTRLVPRISGQAL